MASKHGFTLIELSIVLVIIGLVVGGVLVGQELIRGAEIRATVSQVEKYNTSVNTFITKYGDVPGDLAASKAARLGFFAETTLGGAMGHQDSNGLIEDGQTIVLTLGRGEVLGFWRHLTDAQMIDGNFGTASSGNALDPATGEVTNAITAGTVSQVFPAAKIGRGNYILAHRNATSLVLRQGFNEFDITGITAMATAGNFTLTQALTPLETQNIDQKMDDGQPLNGYAQAYRHNLFPGAGNTTAGDGCMNADNQYDVGALNGNAPNCQLRIRFK